VATKQHRSSNPGTGPARLQVQARVYFSALVFLSNPSLSSPSRSLWRNIAFGALTEEEEQEMREYEQAVRYPLVPRMRQRGHVAASCDDVVVHFEGESRGISLGGSINGGGALSDGLQPLLARATPTPSSRRTRAHQGMHTSNDNTPAIVALSEIRARLMRT
jgi:hypothetical protein